MLRSGWGNPPVATTKKRGRKKRGRASLAPPGLKETLAFNKKRLG
jgi:hypothetical protein